MDAGEQQEGANGEYHAIKGTESPAKFDDGSVVQNTGNGLDVEGIDGDKSTDKGAERAYNEAFAHIPCEMMADVVRQNKIAQIAGKVPQYVILVPEALSPYFATPTVQIRDAGGKEEEADEESFFAGTGLL